MKLVIFAAVILIASTKFGNAFKCYQCDNCVENSKNNTPSKEVDCSSPSNCAKIILKAKIDSGTISAVAKSCLSTNVTCEDIQNNPSYMYYTENTRKALKALSNGKADFKMESECYFCNSGLCNGSGMIHASSLLGAVALILVFLKFY